ncbi:DUF2911 domain-containing protein [Soonwooa sp.]|uniref:DUF2911 domain-containing protein n=1 Tax=Soonwooa sp. TaxID=1938592 RepID=UPI0026321D6E|nr:DUF2911 domain-containing protein [Soonwooa sp.]
MRKLIGLSFLCLGLMASAQTKNDPKQLKFASLDVSPLDMVYYPLDAATGKNVAPIMKITYSRPASKGRPIFGNLVKYNEVWRFGANENTELKVYKPIKIDGKELAAGCYSIYAIPGETDWTMIINKTTDVWGAYAYNAANDLIRVKVPATKLTTPIENFSVSFVKTDDGANMVAAWDSTQVSMPITF